MNIPSLVIGLAAGLFIGILACILYRNKKAKDDKEKIANAEEEALRIINDAIKSAESKKREATLEAKEEILRSRKEYEKEEKERRADLQKQERRLQQKEENSVPDVNIMVDEVYVNRYKKQFFDEYIKIMDNNN